MTTFFLRPSFSKSEIRHFHPFTCHWHCIQLLQDFKHWPLANSSVVNAALWLKSLPNPDLDKASTATKRKTRNKADGMAVITSVLPLQRLTTSVFLEIDHSVIELHVQYCINIAVVFQVYDTLKKMVLFVIRKVFIRNPETFGDNIVLRFRRYFWDMAKVSSSNEAGY